MDDCAVSITTVSKIKKNKKVVSDYNSEIIVAS